jgi:Xaa-Pro aminopeptidase
MRPGAGPQAVQAAMLGGVTAHGAESAYWSGHGLGQDVIEEPWIGREVVDADPTAELALEAGMVLAMHPMVLDLDRRGMAYLANSYVVGPGGGEAVSQVPLGLRTL